MFYAAKNLYSSPTNIGFCNTWIVIGFPTRTSRDAFVQKCPNLATRAITANDIKKFGGKPKRINFYDKHGKYHIHMGNGEFYIQE